MQLEIRLPWAFAILGMLYSRFWVFFAKEIGQHIDYYKSRITGMNTQ